MASTSIAELRRICQHTYPNWSTQPWLFLQIRKLSIYLTWALIRLPLSSNGISLLGIVIGLLAAICMAAKLWLTGLILLQLSMLLDFSDGEVCRFRGEQSKEGSYLDKVYIFLVHPSVFAGFAIGAYQLQPTLPVLAAGFITVVSIFGFCMVVEYARQIVVWKHFKRYIDALAKGRDLLQGAAPTSVTTTATVSTAPNSSPSTARSSVLKKIVSIWDFPYIFFVLSITILLQRIFDFLSPHSNLEFIVFVLFFYAITTPVLTGIFLTKNLTRKVVQQDFLSLATEFNKVFQKIPPGPLN